MDREINNVAVYVRKSREEETEDAIDRQKSVLIDICKKSNWEYELFKEVGSSQDIDRLELQNMLEKVKLFQYDAIVVADLDRLSRSTVHFGMIKETLTGAGCHVITPNKVYDFSIQEDDLFSDLQSVLAKNEYSTIKKRLKRGVKQSAKDGNWMGKKAPVGFKYNRATKKLQQSEDAPIIRRMFEEYMSGLSTIEISHKFTIENVTTSVGMIWSPSGISRMLNNEAYHGTSVYGKTTEKNGKRAIKTELSERIIVDNTHEPIVSQEEWDLVQKIKLDKNSKPVALGANKRKFSGLIKCGLCNRTHSFQTSRYKRKRITSCQTRHYSNDLQNYTNCKNKGMNIVDFENVFYTLFENYMDKLCKYAEKIRHENKDKIKKDYKNGISSLAQHIKRINNDTKRVQQGYIAQIFSEEEASNQIKNNHLQIEDINNKIEELRLIESDSKVDYVSRTLDKMELFMEGVDTLPEKEVNKILRELITEIRYKRTNDFDDGFASIDVIWKYEVPEEGKY